MGKRKKEETSVMAFFVRFSKCAVKSFARLFGRSIVANWEQQNRVGNGSQRSIPGLTLGWDNLTLTSGLAQYEKGKK